MSVNYTDFDKIWASTSPLTPYEFSENNYKQGWNFVGATPPARQMWDCLQKNNDEKMQYLANNYLPLSGGTITGSITSSTFDIIKRNVDDSYLNISGGTGYDSARIALNGKNRTGGNDGAFELWAHNGTNSKLLLGNPDGTLTWGGKNVVVQNPQTLTIEYISNEYVLENQVARCSAYTTGNMLWVQVNIDPVVGKTYSNMVDIGRININVVQFALTVTVTQSGQRCLVQLGKENDTSCTIQIYYPEAVQSGRIGAILCVPIQ